MIEKNGHALRRAEELFARQAEVFAALPAYTDYEIAGSFRRRGLGKLDNTLIIYISGDNGTSPEGTTERNVQPIHLLQRNSRCSGRRADEGV